LSNQARFIWNLKVHGSMLFFTSFQDGGVFLNIEFNHFLKKTSLWTLGKPYNFGLEGKWLNSLKLKAEIIEEYLRLTKM
ncbi:hypothetical protein L9F63_018971, partial [Diploptera punctata]